MKSYLLDTPLLTVQTEKGNVFVWTARNAVEGLQIFGGIGSGKTSGSGDTIACKIAKEGWGGLVLTVKPEEKEMWVKYCKAANRLGDLIIVSPQQRNYFNFLEYESVNDQATANIVHILKTVIRAAQEKEGRNGDDSFWDNALDMLLTNVINLCKLAYARVTVELMSDIVLSAPKPTYEGDFKSTEFYKAFTIARTKVQLKVNEVKAESEQPLSDEQLMDEVPDARVMKHIDQFFLETYMCLSEKTRTIIDFIFSGFLLQFLQEPVYSLFCRNQSTFTPDDSCKGKIILLDLPVKIHQKVGRDCQILFKYIWQRAMERRNLEENDTPVFLWADESQNFLHEHDVEYQATARSKRIATFYISQNLPNYLVNMGGQKAEWRVKSFLGTLGTKIFHANVDTETNRYASDLIGDGYFAETSTNQTVSGHFSTGETVALKIDRIIRPEFFAKLKTGSEKNDFRVEAIMHIQGYTSDNASYRKVFFTQKH